MSQNENAKILVASPTYDGMSYCFESFVNAIKNLDYPKFDVLIVDNSRRKKFWRIIRNIPNIKVIYDESVEKNNMLRLISSRNKILDYAKQKKYDYLLMLDSDVIVPSNIIKKLMQSNKDVISGLYFSYFKTGNKIQLFPVCWKEATNDEYDIMIKNKLITEQQLNALKTKGLSLRRFLTRNEILSKKVTNVMIPCGGCLLLSKNILNSNIKYGVISKKDNFGMKSSDDIYFFKQLVNNGFKLYCDTSVICKHKLKGKPKGFD